MRVCGKKTGIMHINDNDGKGDYHQMPYTFGTNESEGQVWDRIYKGLKDIKFDGTLSFETFPTMNSFPKGMSASVLKTICSIGEYMAERIENEG